jgi:hypothetical protein
VTASTARPPDRAKHSLLGIGAVATVAGLAVAVVVITGGSRGQREVSVYPNARTQAASARTAITFRGTDADRLDELIVTGSRSGRHAGRLEEHPDAEGAAFVPERPFAPGERVTVDVGMPVAGSEGELSSFVVAGTSTAPAPPFDEAKPVQPRAVQRFRSRPDLRPPAISVMTAAPAARPGKVFVAPKRGATQQGPMILDERGDLVWFHPLPGDRQAFDFRAQRYRGAPVLTWWEGRMATYRGAGVGRIVDQEYRTVATVRAGNGYELDAHELRLTPSGTALVMSYVTVPWDLSRLGGRPDGLVEDNVVQEIDVESGAVLFEWHALGTIRLGESYRSAPRRRGQPHDPFHLNSAALDTDGNLLLSARHTNAVYKIDRRTGAVLWRLGGKRSSFAMGPGTTFRLQHDARRRPDGAITLFDNVAEKLPARGKRSRGMAIALDHERETASLIEAFEHPDGLLSPTQGSMQPLQGGGAFVGWGGLQPVFTEFDADGRAVFDARFAPKGVESYRAYRMPWEAVGAGQPSVAARTRGARTSVRVSWNGATGVASWRVRAGGATLATSPRRRFETALAFAGRPRKVVVEALDDGGRVLATSAATPVPTGRPAAAQASG